MLLNFISLQDLLKALNFDSINVNIAPLAVQQAYVPRGGRDRRTVPGAGR